MSEGGRNIQLNLLITDAKERAKCAPYRVLFISIKEVGMAWGLVIIFKNKRTVCNREVPHNGVITTKRFDYKPVSIFPLYKFFVFLHNLRKSRWKKHHIKAQKTFIRAQIRNYVKHYFFFKKCFYKETISCKKQGH